MSCGLTKEFLSKKGVPFVDRDITKDPSALNELRQLGFTTTPVIRIDGQTIVGFDEEKLSQALGL
jgi:glutaredoxin